MLFMKSKGEREKVEEMETEGEENLEVEREGEEKERGEFTEEEEDLEVGVRKEKEPKEETEAEPDGEIEEEDIGEGKEEEEKRPFRSAFWDLMKDVIIAFIIVIIIIGSIYLYTGNWPPVVVVESSSMQHSDTESSLSVIDTGDLVLVKSIDSEEDIVPYMKGKRIGHETYSEYGDVLIFRKNGYTDTTPVIHRVILWLEYNETGDSFDIPELKYHTANITDGEWYVVGGEQRWYDLSGMIVLKDIGYDHVNVGINLGSILNTYTNSGVEPHSGFITLGDHNRGSYDQGGSMSDGHKGRVRPVRPEWVVGKGRGELPWFGLIKLYFQEPTIRETAPSNSWDMLFITLVLIIAVPICIDIFLILYERRKEKMEEGEKGKEEGKGEVREEEEEPEKEIEGGETKEDEEPPPPEDWGKEEPPPPEDEFEE